MVMITPEPAHGADSASQGDEKGAALIVTLAIVATLLGFGLTVMSTVESATNEQTTARAQLQRLFIAETGIRLAVNDLKAGGDGNLGSAMAPLAFGGGDFRADSVDNGDGTLTVTSRAGYGTGRRVVQALIRARGGVFDHAIFAGNSSEDLTYALDLGGYGTEADQIGGSVYSGNDINVWGDASITGTARAAGTVNGASGEEGTTQPGFDFSGFDYANIADIDVVADFAAQEYSASDDAGGTAMQVPEANPSHIFRKNPSDRSTEIGGTVKDDYFLEDPYEPIGVDATQDGSDPYVISVTNDGSLTGYNKIIYIDGNLWIHNIPTYSFRFQSVGSDGTQLTFVVRGNIYFSDNIFLENDQQDGLAFIALNDPNEADSGNIYFGDPRGGTLEYMHAYMYAENDFIDNHMDASGSRTVEVVGTMAAGDQVSINRTFQNHHSRLTVTPDLRLSNGALTLPGIPQQSQSVGYELISWIELSPDS